MKSGYKAEHGMYKFCKRRRGCYTAQIIANVLERVLRDHRDKLPSSNTEGDPEFFREEIEESKNPDTSGLPSDGSKGQTRARVAFTVLAYEWILEEVSTEYIKQKIRIWLREYRPNLYVGAELSEIDMDSGLNKSEREQAKELLQEGHNVIEHFDDKYGFEVDDDARVGIQAKVTNRDEVLEQAKKEEV